MTQEARFNKMFEFFGITKRKFQEELGFQDDETFNSEIQNKTKRLNRKLYDAFKKSEYNEYINITWLFEGSGNMLKD